MKKIQLILLSIFLMFGLFACESVANTVAQAENNTTRNVELEKKIEDFFSKDIVKKILDGKTISDILRDAYSNLSDDEKARIKGDAEKYGITIDEKIFESDADTYNWIANSLRLALKIAIKNGEITKDNLDKLKGLSMFGIKIPDINIDKNISDEDLEEFCQSAVGFLDNVMNPAILKLLGVDIDGPNALENVINAFNKIINGNF